jgi:hypothetical protein
MVKFLFEIKDLIWLLRICLAAVFVSGIYLQTQGTQFFSDLASNHITTSSTLIFLAIMSFAYPFIKIKKKDEMGGVYVMRKLTVLTVVFGGIIAVLLFLSWWHPGLISSMFTGLGGGIGAGFGSLIVWLEALPLNMWHWFLIGGAGCVGVYALIAHSIVPRIRKPKVATQEWAQGPPQANTPLAQQQSPQPVPVKQEQEA